MNLKQVLENIVIELENTEALVAAIQSVLIEKEPSEENQIKKKFPTLLLVTQNRLSALRIEISGLQIL